MAAPLPQEAARFEARPHRTWWVLSFPVMVSLLAEPITGLVDTAFVARLGAAPLAALGVGTIAISSVLWAFNFLGTGTQTEVATALGARDEASARETGFVAVTLALLIGTLCATAAGILLPQIVRGLGGAGEVARHAEVYLGVRLLGGPAILAMTASLGALRGLHAMRTVLWIAVGANALNVALDALLIFGAGPIPALGVAGAAWASVTSQWVGAGVCFAVLGQRVGWPRRVDLRRARNLLVVGRDLFLRTALLVAFLLLATREATRMGAEAGAAHQVTRQVWMTTALFLDAFAAVAQSLVGTGLGAGRPDLARRAARLAVGVSLAFGTLLGLGMVLTERWVVVGWVPDVAVAVFRDAWWVAAVAQPLNALSFATDGLHWGTRDYRYLRDAMILATLVGVGWLLWATSRRDAALADIWWATTAWMGVRAAFGWVRLRGDWPTTVAVDSAGARASR